jgi:hypothetical protein
MNDDQPFFLPASAFIWRNTDETENNDRSNDDARLEEQRRVRKALKVMRKANVHGSHYNRVRYKH